MHIAVVKGCVAHLIRSALGLLTLSRHRVSLRSRLRELASHTTSHSSKRATRILVCGQNGCVAVASACLYSSCSQFPSYSDRSRGEVTRRLSMWRQLWGAGLQEPRSLRHVIYRHATAGGASRGTRKSRDGVRGQ